MEPQLVSPRWLPSSTTREDSVVDGSNRYLRTEYKLQHDSAALIAWYCLLLSVVMPTLCCLLWCWFQRYRSHRRAQMTLQREHELDEMSRIEANIEAYSVVEKSKRSRLVRSAIKRQVKKIKASDLEKQPSMTEQSRSDCSSSSEDGVTCSICLEHFRVGDAVAESSNAVCHHMFHEDCIVSWLLAKQNALCPYCRRPFLCLPLGSPRSSQTSVTSHDHSSTVLDDNESNRPDGSVVATHDDRGLEDVLLDVVIEDEHRLSTVEDEETMSAVEREDG